MKNTITTSELKNLLLTLPAGANFITLQTITPVKMNKTGNPYLEDGICNVSTINCQLQSDYENVVNNQLKREGKPANFTSAARAWGSHVGNTAVIEHKGEYYLAYRAIKCLKTRMIDSKGRFVSKDAIAPFLPKESGNSRQGTDKEIIWRTPKISNIRKIHINRKKFEVMGE